MQPAAPALSTQAEIAKTMQPHSAQNMYVSAGNNSSGNARTNPQTGAIFRGPPPTVNQPRGAGATARHVHMQTMYTQPMHQMMPGYTQFPPRQPTFPAPHIQYAPVPYYSYPYLQTLPQQPSHSRSGVAVNTVNSVNVGNTLPVQTGPNGPLAGPGPSSSQLQMLTGAVQQGANTVIGVGATGSGQVSVAPMVGVMPANVAPPPTQSTGRRRLHRLQIIDPNTNKDILDDLDKNNSNAESDLQEHLVPIGIVPKELINIGLGIPGSDERANVPYIEQIPAQRSDIVVGQTPVVSARSDAPSVEILPTPQKPKSKKIPIVSPKEESESSTVHTTLKVDDASADTQAVVTRSPNETIQQQIQPDCVPQQQQQPQKLPRQQQQQSPPQSTAVQEEACTSYQAIELAKTPLRAAGATAAQLPQDEAKSTKPVTRIETTTGASSVATSNASKAQQSIDAVNVLADSVGIMHITETDIKYIAATATTTAAAASVATTVTPSLSSGKVPEPSAAEGQQQQQQTVCTTDHTSSDQVDIRAGGDSRSQSTEPQLSSHESTPDETDRAAVAQAEPQNPNLEAITKTAKASTTATSIPPSAEAASATSAIPAATSATSLPAATMATKENAKENGSSTVSPDTASAASDQADQSSEPEAAATATDQAVQSLISYNEGQWSPNNPTGKKQYDREQLLQLREAKASRIQPEVNNTSILPQPNLMPTFARNGKGRVSSSMVGMIGGNRSNESAGNFGGKQLSMSGVQGRNSMSKGMMIHVNLSLNQDVKLNETENAWRPRVLNKGESESLSDAKLTQEKDDLVRRVRGILNKLTPEKFDTLVEEIIKLKIDTPDKMDDVIVLVFEKAIDEPNFSVSYAKLCQRLIFEVKARDERMESGTRTNLAHFRNALLDKTEREFTQNVSQSKAKENKLQPMVDKIKKCTDPNEKAELEALLEEEERKIRRRSGGTVRFIGELFKIGMLTGKIIYSCIDTLLNPHSEDMLECLCKLLTTVGAKFEQTPVNPKEPGRCYSLEKSIARMQAIASKTDKDGAKVSSRVRFMLQDVIDLRKNKWQSTRNEAPKTMGQIEKETKNEQLSAQYMNYSGSMSTSGPNGPQVGSGKRDDRGGGGGGGGGGRYGDNRSGYGGSHSQRGDSGSMRHQQQGGNSGHSNGNNDDNIWHVQTSKGSRSQAVDTNKLEGLSLQLNQNFDTKKMGGVNQFIWNNNARVAQPTNNSFAVLSSLIDKSSTDRDRDRNDRDRNDRDRSGPKNKGSYNKGSMERDRYGDRDRGINSRTGSSQGSRENSSSRGSQQGRGMMNTSLQKSASHSKYGTQFPPAARLAAKSSVSNPAAGGLYRLDHQSSSSQSVQNNSKASPPPAVFTELSDNELKIIKSVLSEMMELAAASKTVTPSTVTCIERIPEAHRCGFLYYILTDYLHLANVGKQYRRYLAITVAHLIHQNYMSLDHFRLAYKEFSEIVNDLIVDIPELWLYVLQFAGPLIVKKILTVADLWNKQLKDSSPPYMGKKFLKTYLTYCTREVGPNFTRSMWKRFNLHWSDFMPDNEVNDFIATNNLEYVENESKWPLIEVRESHEKHVKNVIENVEHLLKEGATADCIIDYCNGNIVSADKLFIRSLTHTLSNFAILFKENTYKLETENFQKFCIPVFQRFIDLDEEHQLECLYSMQLLVHSLEHPRGLLSELFGELYDGDVIQKESLCKWRDSKDQSAGKGVAVKSLNPFFNSLFSDETH
ncbi:eukaryotic translation initiation factor 4 gamma 3 isoform X2 [Scaptodrosophila lebanonensis]|uniref:Eukaryotic translation initiation factor 4 gamma 3 isoform X2 n=1 Tax=Drosophila lebanonensis TaxID=7225 RepID=A0A6J2TT92_DROLE|nr:eukaryotic translation initiation factor 4 gamma 3 isoform X2 [Scaptodrosophila lebanonensis]